MNQKIKIVPHAEPERIQSIPPTPTSGIDQYGLAKNHISQSGWMRAHATGLHRQAERQNDKSNPLRRRTEPKQI